MITQFKEGADFFKLNTFEGDIYIKVEDDTIKYKFIPSDDFNEIIKETILTKNSKLMDISLKRLRSTLVNTYKDIF